MVRPRPLPPTSTGLSRARRTIPVACCASMRVRSESIAAMFHRLARVGPRMSPRSASAIPRRRKGRGIHPRRVRIVSHLSLQACWLSMDYRQLGRTGWNVSTISFGAWAIGGTWGPVEDTDSLKALHRAVDLGLNFFDTADVYGDGHSEQLLARLKKERKENFYITTKAGRRLPQQTPEGYSRENLTAWIERSLKNLGTDTLDLLQLHCPPPAVLYMPEVFGVLDDLVKGGKLRYYGVSVEKVEEALKAIEFPGVQTIQIIFNLFRQRPAELLFPEAQRRRVGILARVPLASGMLSGRISRDRKFAKDDHRNFNRHGEAFDRGETFAGVDFETALRAVEDLKKLKPKEATLAQLALRWILEFPAVTCAIPGAKRASQVSENLAASDLPHLPKATRKKISAIYEGQIKALVHH